MRSQDKERVMAAFKSGEIDLLVATTVIGLGVDVPQARLMIVETPSAWGSPTANCAGAWAADRSNHIAS
jgi:ATP-dependent DNA helicase RecG